jgi:hypothetical protein
MAWETRGGGGVYYTRSLWRGGRVVRQYLGNGPDAERAAAEDEARRSARRAALDARRAEAARLDEADAPLAALLGASDLLARAALVGGGFHQHRGEWRRTNVTDD